VANAIRLLQTTDQFFNVAASDRWYLRFFRGNILPTLASLVSQFSPAKEFLFPVVSQIALNYEDSSLSQPQQRHKFAVKAGDRMPYFLVEGENVYDQLRAPKFHLLIFSDGQHNNSSLKLDAEYADSVDLHVIPLYPRVIEIFGSKQSFQLLLRPDHYIAFLSPHCSLDHLTAYFKRVEVFG
jgi:hypothetical protein